MCNWLGIFGGIDCIKSWVPPGAVKPGCTDELSIVLADVDCVCCCIRDWCGSVGNDRMVNVLVGIGVC